MILNKHPDQNNISLNVNGTNVPLKSCVKLLGVFIDYELTFSEHVNYICKRTSRQLNAIRRISKYLKRDCLMKLFHTFVSSNYNYCPTIWHFTSKSSTVKIEKVHKAALRVVYNDYTTSYSGLLDMSKRPLGFKISYTAIYTTWKITVVLRKATCSQRVWSRFSYTDRIAWLLFSGVQFTICQYWLRKWFGAEQATSYYVSRCSLLAHICVTRPRLLKQQWLSLNCIYDTQSSVMLQWPD